MPVHEFFWYLDRNAGDSQRMRRKAVEGDWLILDHVDWSKLQSRPVMTGAIVIGRDDGLSSTSHSVAIQKSAPNPPGATGLFQP